MLVVIWPGSSPADSILTQRTIFTGSSIFREGEILEKKKSQLFGTGGNVQPMHIMLQVYDLTQVYSFQGDQLRVPTALSQCCDGILRQTTTRSNSFVPVAIG